MDCSFSSKKPLKAIEHGPLSSLIYRTWPYPLVNIQKAIENGLFIVGLPIQDGDFPVRNLLVYQRVSLSRGSADQQMEIEPGKDGNLL